MNLDCRGQLCPQPVIELAKAVRELPPGTVIRIETDDPAAAVDIPAWCRMRGHGVGIVEQHQNVLVHEVTVAA